jgi:hypothetical protein
MPEVTTEEQRVIDFNIRCQMVGGYLHSGRSVTMTEAQLKFYGVTPHQVITELMNWVISEEAEEVWEAAHEGAYHCDRVLPRTYVIYCTKVQDKYKFKAKVKA